MDLKRITSLIAKNRLLFLLGAVGVLILLFTGTTPKKEQTTSPMEAAEAYRVAMEGSLTETIRTIRGVGKVKVFLTLATSEVAVYEKNVNAESETLASVGGEGLLVAYRMPKIAGVVVVCEGGDDAVVRYELTSLLRSALALDSTAIHIAPLR